MKWTQLDKKQLFPTLLTISESIKTQFRFIIDKKQTVSSSSTPKRMGIHKQ